MSNDRFTRQDDIAALEILHARDHLGMTMKAAAEHASRAVGHRITRGQAIGLFARVNEAAASQPCKARRKANRDGGMPSRWWAA